MTDKREREQLNVVIESEQRAFLERYAKEHDLRLAQVVRKAIRLLMAENSAFDTSTVDKYLHAVENSAAPVESAVLP